MKIKLPVFALYGLGAIAVVVLTMMVTKSPMLLGVAIAGIGGVFLLKRLGDWWRRSYFILLLLLSAGSSSIESVAGLAARGKILALALLVVVTFFTLKGNQGKIGKLHSTLIFTLWSVVAIGIASSLWSSYPLGTLINAATVAAFVFILHRVSTIRWKDKANLVCDVGTMYLALFIPLLIGLAMSAASLEDAVLFNGRHQGFYSNPNMLGLMAVFGTTVGVAYASYKRSLLLWISLAVPLAAVVLSGSRTAFLATGIGLVWLILRGKLSRAITAAVVAGVAILVMELSGRSPFAATVERFSANEGGDLLNQRSIIWEQVVSFVEKNPGGTGLGSTFAALEEATALGLNPSGLVSVHNSYFQLLYEIGWFAIPLIALLFMVPILAVLKVKPVGIGGGLAATILAGTVTHFTESAMFGVGQPYPYIFWFVVAAALVTIHHQRRESGVETKDQSDEVLTKP